MSLLLKAAADAGLQANWFTYFASGPGGPTAIKQTGLAGKIHDIAEGDANTADAAAQAAEVEFRKKYGMGIWHRRAINEMTMFVNAVKEVNSLDPKTVALKMEGMTSPVFGDGQGRMRKDDHQWFQDMYIRSFGPLAGGQKFDEEGTQWGWTVKSTVPAADTLVPTTCQMTRP
jgi:branched-chain amino acid transport system substrate-binding protein